MSGIYVHVPFCKSKCTYCDFASYPKEIGKAESYFACLYRELRGQGLKYKDKVFDTVYVGGGTPSVVPASYIVGAIKQVKKCFNLAENLEITIELKRGTTNSLNALIVYIPPKIFCCARKCLKAKISARIFL